MAVKISKFDRASLSALRIDIDAALAAVASRHGISMKLGRVTFSDQSFKGSIEAAIGGKSPEWVRYEQYAPLLKLDTALLGNPINFGTHRYDEVVGLKSGAQSVIAARGGKMYRIAVDKFVQHAKRA